MASYTRFEDGDVLVSSEKVSAPIWSNNSNVLRANITGSFNTGNAGSYSSDFYLDIVDSTVTGSPVQFSLVYADKSGSGSFCYEQNVAELEKYSPSSTMYGQYRSLVLGDEESEFYFEDGVASRDFWAISIDRARFKESLMPGSFKLILGTGDMSTGLGKFMLQDEFAVNPSNSTRYFDSGRVYNIYGSSAVPVISGSTVTGWTSGSAPQSGYGFFLPDIGLILLDCEKCVNEGVIVNASGSVITNINDIRFDSSMVSPSVHNAWDNADDLRRSIKWFELRSEETVTSNYVWVRAKNSQFNYSMNPSFITANGELRRNIMINSPETYITSVGLYNDAGALLAVAKLSRPLSKSFSKEALIRIKLDY